MLTVTHNHRIYSAEDAAKLIEMGVPQGAINAEIEAIRAKHVSAECRRRIYAIASVEAQMNMTAAVGVISSKAASSRTDDEKAILTGAEAAIGWVAAMRAAVATLAADPDADFKADAAWPEVPPEALVMIQNF